MDQLLKDFLTHLEFLGYVIEAQAEPNTYMAQHRLNGKTFIKPYMDGILFQQYFRVNDEATKQREEFLEMLNELNSAANVVTYVAGTIDNPFLRMDGSFMGVYDKQKFASFIEAYIFDTGQRLARHESAKRFLV